MKELSRVKNKLEAWVKARNWGMECEENKDVATFIRKLDKEALNLYTPVRVELGTREPSWIGLILNGLRPEQRIEMWMEDRQS